MPVMDPQAFGKALKRLAEGDQTPYAHVSKARLHMEAAEMHALAFGLINLMIVKGDYDDSRKFLADNLTTGSDNMEKVLKGLNRVAANYRNVELANILVPRDFTLPDVRADNSNVDNYVEGATLYFWKIGMLAMFTQGVSAASAKLAVTAGVAALLWLGYMPDDEAISKAHSHWTLAGEELGKFDSQLMSITTDFGRAWEDKGQEAFQTWITNFANEVDECKVAVETGAKTMSSLETTLATQQHTWFLVAVANLVVLAAMEIAGWAFPPSKPAWKAAMEVVGGIFSITTGSWMGYATAVVKALGTTLAPLVVAQGFVTEKKGTGSDLDENGVDFNEVKLDDAAINTLYTEATS